MVFSIKEMYVADTQLWRYGPIKIYAAMSKHDLPPARRDSTSMLRCDWKMCPVPETRPAPRKRERKNHLPTRYDAIKKCVPPSKHDLAPTKRSVNTLNSHAMARLEKCARPPNTIRLPTGHHFGPG